MRKNPETKVWKFCENRDLVFTTRYNVGNFENEFLKLSGNFITVFGSHLKGYAWDGCTPKWEILDFLPGTPDGVVRKQQVEVITDRIAPDGGRWCEVQFDYVPKTYYASLVHDLLYQFKADVPVSRKTTDLIFFEMMRATKFKPAKLYYLAVRLVGGIYGKWKTND